MTKKIGLLTFPTVTNHGGYLQAFATYNFLMENGYKVKVINYRNRKHLLNEYKALFVKKNILHAFINVRRFVKFRKAQRRFAMDKMVTRVERLHSDDYDIVVVGADIVWNYETPFVGRDSIYFGNGLSNKFLIAYSASMGNSNPKNPIPNYVKKGLTKFSSISVRDQNTKDIVESLNNNAKLTLDPCLIYDYSKYEILPKINHKYILVYAFDFTDKDIIDLKQFAYNNHLKIISIGFNVIHEWCDINIMVIDPLEFLGYYKQASYVFTSTFHGTLFAIKYNKTFALRMNFTIERKVNTILEKLGLQNQVIKDNLANCLKNEIDFVKVNKILNQEVEKSREFLINSIEKYDSNNS